MPDRSRRWPTVALAAFAVALLAGACGDDAGTTGDDDSSRQHHDHALDPDHVHDHSGMVVVATTEGPDGRLEIHYGDDEGAAATMVDVTAYAPGTAPTSDQQQAADELVDAVRRATQAWPTVEDAEAAGFRRWPGIDEYHLAHPDHVADDGVLDPERPEFLMFDGDGALVAAMFLAGGNSEAGPQLGGPLTVWHYHPWGPSCWTAGGLLPAEASPDGDGTCPDGLLYAERSPEMLHVWVIDHPGGPFSSDMGGVLIRAE